MGGSPQTRPPDRCPGSFLGDASELERGRGRMPGQHPGPLSPESPSAAPPVDSPEVCPPGQSLFLAGVPFARWSAVCQSVVRAARGGGGLPSPAKPCL